MNNLVGNWEIELSEKSVLRADGTDSLYESISNAGSLTIYEDPNSPSKESKLYDLFYIDANQDTIQKQGGTLFTDEKKNRIILQKALNDSTAFCDMVWTIEKERRKKQIWQMFGVDGTFFYPTNNQNPDAANNWVMWRITLKREK